MNTRLQSRHVSVKINKVRQNKEWGVWGRISKRSPWNMVKRFYCNISVQRTRRKNWGRSIIQRTLTGGLLIELKHTSFLLEVQGTLKQDNNRENCNQATPKEEMEMILISAGGRAVRLNNTSGAGIWLLHRNNRSQKL